MTFENGEALKDAGVTIVMATFQGERFLAQQLESIAAQAHRNWRLHVSDDGSTDLTGKIVRSFSDAVGQDRVGFVDGPRKGFAINFMTALRSAPDAPFFAFADQDDLWKPDKLKRALAILQRTPADRPALYCGRTTLVDEAANPIGASPLFSHKPSFANALVQNIGGGNTMVFNRAARDALVQVSVDHEIVAHDWLAYLLVSGMGGYVYYDANPALLYRQHGGNLVGKNNSWGDRATRVALLMRGRFRDWTECNVRILEQLQNLLTAENRDMLHHFKQAREGSLVHRLQAFRRARFYRQTIPGNVGLLLAIVFNRL